MGINSTRLRPLGAIKNMFAPAGRMPRRVRFGLYRNLVLRLDLQTQLQLFLGLWERETYRYISRAARRAQWMIDVGAGKGELCLFFLMHARHVHVVAIEPNATDIREFAENLALNGFERRDIELIPKLVSPHADAQTIALDDVNIDRSWRGFLKIDVDGAEMEVLRSGATLIQPHAVDVLIETHSLELERDCRSWLAQRGFATTIVPNAWWRLFIPEYRTIPHNRWLWATSPAARP